MAEKLIVEPFAQFYVLRRSDRSSAGIIDNLADAHLFAASRLMLQALERVLAVYGLPERAIAAAIPDVIAAIKVAKGE
jgi:hypothetical protein